jgi:hypothetical protein
MSLKLVASNEGRALAIRDWVCEAEPIRRDDFGAGRGRKTGEIHSLHEHLLFQPSASERSGS